MPIKILMPALSPTMKAGKIVEWKIKEGDLVSGGMEILDIETDKAVMPMETADEGTLAQILVPTGSENVPVGEIIGIILEEGETKEDIAQKNIAIISSNDNVHNSDTQNIEPPLNSKNNNNLKRIKASPLAKRIAKQNNINLSNISGSGYYGRIMKKDVISQNSNQKQEITETKHGAIKVSKIRKAIAKRLLDSTQNIPHFYLTSDCEINNLINLRVRINENGNHKITLNDLIVKATALSIARVPEINYSWGEEEMIQRNTVDISFAVAINEGLITPIVKNADKKPISQISTEIKQLINKAKDNKLIPDEFEGGSFTVSNLGMYKIKSFIAIINPPQSAIFAIGSGEDRVVVKDGKMEIATLMTVTLSCDHRIIDGAIGANFMKIFKEYIENPVTILI